MDANSQVERGRRVKMLRAMLGKNQQEFAALCGVSAISINLWEKGAYSGLSKKGAQKIIQQLAKENISCSLAWLLEGIGNPPTKSLSQSIEPHVSQSVSQVQAVSEEVKLFLKHFPNGVIMEITDDSIGGYKFGDYIGGLWLSSVPQNTASEAFIVCLADGTILLRQIAYDEKKQQYFLYATNTKSTAPQLYLADANIKKCAEVIRHWRVSRSANEL
jgi:DNA-binding XRE family transcriptional regulator